MRKRRPIVLLLAALALGAAAYGTPAPTPLDQAIQQIDRLAAAEYQKDRVGGLTVGVVSGGRLVWSKSYGLADMTAARPATADTVYRIGSITKMFTAVMLLQLAERGTVRLSDPVEKYYPEISNIQGRFAGAPPVTLVQLAAHTSGLATEPEDLDRFLHGPVAAWEKTLAEALPRTRFVAEPGTRYRYSNIGYAVLGAALSRAAQEPYVDYVKRRIFAPLGMNDSAFEPEERLAPRLAAGYQIRDGRVDADTPAREHRGRGYKVPNGAVYSTLPDLARYMSFELGGGPPTVLGAETLQERYARGVWMNEALSAGYGLGFEAYRRGDFILLGHGGAVAGYESGLLFHRPTKTGIIVLRNAGGGKFDVGGLCMRAAELLAGAKH